MRRTIWLGLLIFVIGAYGCKSDGSDGWCADPDDPRCGSDCGNGFCEQGETYSNCSADCDPGCGDHVCSYNESRMVNEDGRPQACPTDCAPNCGNGYLDYRETCDDGNTIPGDGCSPYCVVEPNEEPPGCCRGSPNGVCEGGCGENSSTCPEDCTS